MHMVGKKHKTTTISGTHMFGFPNDAVVWCFARVYAFAAGIRAATQ